MNIGIFEKVMGPSLVPFCTCRDRHRRFITTALFGFTHCHGATHLVALYTAQQSFCFLGRHLSSTHPGERLVDPRPGGDFRTVSIMAVCRLQLLVLCDLPLSRILGLRLGANQ